MYLLIIIYTDHGGGDHLNGRVADYGYVQLCGGMRVRAGLACCCIGWTAALSVTTAPLKAVCANDTVHSDWVADSNLRWNSHDVYRLTVEGRWDIILRCFPPLYSNPSIWHSGTKVKYVSTRPPSPPFSLMLYFLISSWRSLQLETRFLARRGKGEERAGAPTYLFARRPGLCQFA